MTTTPSIPDWFRNRNVFITGATGFMGKVLVYKLLMSCPDIGNIFILVREKKGIDPQARLKIFVEAEPFRELREKYPERLKKLIVLSGDTTIEGLALNTSDKERIMKEVSVVFHMAANVKFHLSLKTAVNINTKSTMNILALAEEMPHLESFVYVSTSYCQCGETVLEERAYPPPITPESIMVIANTMSDDILDAMTPKFIGKEPNTYALSKALCEDLVAKSRLPTGVARPSIVGASWQEPVPGWIENMNGPTGMMVAAGTGLIRSMLGNSDNLIDIIPCDLAINAIIALAWHVGLQKLEKPIFMNVTESGDNPISWATSLKTGKKHFQANPFSRVLWYPNGIMTSSKIIHWFCVVFFHMLPAYLLDTLIVLTGNKPFLVRTQQRLSVGLNLLQYYTTKKWVFRNDRKKDLQQRLCPADKEVFVMDTKTVCWDEYMLLYILGIRQYCLKDDPSTLPRARRVLQYYYIAYWFSCITLMVLVLWFIYSWIYPSRIIGATLIDHIEM